MLLLLIPVALWIIFSMIDKKNDDEIERLEEYDELMTELEQQAIDAEERHLEMLESIREERRRHEDQKSRPVRTERRVIRKPDGSYVAQEITEYEID